MKITDEILEDMGFKKAALGIHEIEELTTFRFYRNHNGKRLTVCRHQHPNAYSLVYDTCGGVYVHTVSQLVKLIIEVGIRFGEEKIKNKMRQLL